jgi:phage-related protein
VRKIYYYQPRDETAPFLDFMDSLDVKARQKIIYSLKCLAISPGKFSEPQVKHFSIERYKRLYELREKSRVMLRIILTPDAKGNIILLHPFIKQHKRNTYQALETSLGMLADIRQNPDTLREYSLSGRTSMGGCL